MLHNTGWESTGRALGTLPPPDALGAWGTKRTPTFGCAKSFCWRGGWSSPLDLAVFNGVWMLGGTGIEAEELD